MSYGSSGTDFEAMCAEIDAAREVLRRAKAYAIVSGLFTGGYEMDDYVAILDLLDDESKERATMKRLLAEWADWEPLHDMGCDHCRLTWPPPGPGWMNRTHEPDCLWLRTKNHITDNKENTDAQST